MYVISTINELDEEFEDTKGVIKRVNLLNVYYVIRRRKSTQCVLRNQKT